MSKRQDKREKLLQIAVEMYGRDGSFTARDLTAAAGMNIASLNYYFGSKENLVIEIEQRLLQIFTQEITDIGATGKTAQERLCALLYAVSERLLANPGLTRHFIDMMISGDEKAYDLLEVSVGRKSLIFGVLAEILHENGLISEDEIYNRIIIAFCALAPVFVTGHTLSSSALLLQQDSFISSHISTLTTMLLAPASI